MSLERNLEDLQENLKPPASTFANFFTEGKLQEAYNRSAGLAALGLATQRTAQRQFRETYKRLMNRIEDMMDERPYIRKQIMEKSSEVTKSAELSFQRGQRNLQGLTASMANRTFVGERMGLLAKSKEQQKQKLASSVARERIREDMARKQLWRAVIQRQNESISAALSGVQSMAQQQGTAGMAGLNAAMGGMLSAGAGITGMGLARGSNLLSEQATGLNLETNVLGTLTDWETGDIGMQAGLDAIKIGEDAAKANEGLQWLGAITGGVASGLGLASTFGGKTRELKGGWEAARKGSKALGSIFGGE